jgi:hypothetical protein
MVKETYEDGWDCVPQLSKASNCLEEARHEKYEIDNCVRETPLDELVVNLKEKLEEAILHLDEIDINVEYKTVEDEE